LRSSVLEEAGALKADVLVATTGDDEDNLVISLLAKRQFDVPRVVARNNYPENRWLFNERWGVDVARIRLRDAPIPHPGGDRLN